MPSKKLRSSTKCLSVLKRSPGDEHLEIKGSRFPTYEQVLLCFLSNVEKLKLTRKGTIHDSTVAELVLNQVLVHYEKVRIPTERQETMIQDIQMLYADYENACASNGNSRKDLLDKLYKTMPFWKRNIIQIIESQLENSDMPEIERVNLQSDILFLKSMMTDRIATYGSVDWKTAHHEAQRPRCKRKRNSDTNKGKRLSYEDDVSWEPPRSHKKVKTGITLFLCPDFLNNPQILACALENNIPVKALCDLMRVLVEAGGGDPEMLILEYDEVQKFMDDYKKTLLFKV